jgi:UDP-N-acetylglucosamine diphosphorylase/glucosamine-1-phosphate N-acetyltransferase
MNGSLLLFEDRKARSWHPFALTRPAGELTFGVSSIRDRIEHALGISASAYLPGPGLDGFEEPGAPPVHRPEAPSRGPWVVLSTRYIPPTEGLPRALASAAEALTPRGLRLVVAGGATAGWLLPPAGPVPPPATLLDPPSPSTDGGRREEERPRFEIPGKLLESPWQLLSENAARVATDLEAGFVPGREELRPFDPPAGVHVLGRHPVTTGEGVTVDPTAVFDAREGPIHLAGRVHVDPHSLVRGPAFVGEGTVLMGGVFDRMSCGPVCKLRGEISHSVFLGYTNKAHDGYIGHSILGRWVNLGAQTTNSDLKNNYGPIRVGWGDGTSDTGLLKFGVLLGDHVKTGIGTLLGAGTVVGAGTNLFGGGMPGKWVPPFRWGSAGAFVPHRIEAFLETAARAMGRRGQPLTRGQREFLTSVWRSVDWRG